MKTLYLEEFEQKIANSELGKEWIKNPFVEKDIWPFVELGYDKDRCKINGQWNIYYADFVLPWLKLLAKLTTKYGVTQRQSMASIYKRVATLKHLDDFLIFKGFSQPESLNHALLEEFVSEKDTRNRSCVINYVTKLWKDENWLKVLYYPLKYRKSTPKIEIIPEEILCKLYENFDLFPAPLERLFRLQFVLGCRIVEMLQMPRQCLKQEGKEWFLLRWIAKRNCWQFYQIHYLVAELVQEQQRCIETQLGKESDFDKLFCKVSTASRDGAPNTGRFGGSLLYLPETLPKSIIQGWLKDFSEKMSLKDKYGNLFYLKSHMFRRTKASIMAYCEVEDEYIATVLGHSSLDMLPHYRQRSLEKLEKEAATKGYVDMYGRATTFKPRKLRYEKLAEILKVSTPLGECHRPIMLGDCQYRYACLSCDHHRVTSEDKVNLEADFYELSQDLEKAQAANQDRRVTEINRLLNLIKIRLQGLEKIENLSKNKLND
jgi:hypothetical protein